VLIEEIGKQTGNKIKLNPNYNDAELTEFKVVNQSFWQTIDQLGRQSGNVYAKEAYHLPDRITNEPTFQSGSFPDCPVAYDGPFKALITDVSLKKNYINGKCEAQFLAVIIAEPKNAGFQYQIPSMSAASNEQGQTFSKPSGIWYDSSWQDSRGGFAAFDNEWFAVKLLGVSEGCRQIKELTFTVLVRMIRGQDTLVFSKLGSVQLPFNKQAKDYDFSLKALTVSGQSCSVKLTVKGATTKIGWGTFQFHLETKGGNLGTLHPRETRHEQNQVVYELQYNGSDNLPEAKDLAMVISYPAASIGKTLQFRFKNLALPK